MLEAISVHQPGIMPEVIEKIVAYTKRICANRGNHDETTAQKFLPTFTFEELEEAALGALRNGAQLGTSEQLRQELTALRASLFDPDFEPLVTAKSPRGSLDIIQASANNFYSGVSLADLKD